MALLVDPFQHGSSRVHTWNPQFKILGVLALVTSTAIVPIGSWSIFAGIAMGAFFIALLSGVSLSRLGWRFLALEPLALGVSLLALFQPEGMNSFLTLLSKSTLCLAWMLLLTTTTPFSAILATLQRLWVPRLLVTILALAWRYLFVLSEEMERVSRARRSRTLRSGTWFSWNMTASVAGHLFLRTLDRAERVFAAMSARGWNR